MKEIISIRNELHRNILPKYGDLLGDMWQKRNYNNVIQQNHNIKVSEINVAIKELHQKLDSVSNKKMNEIIGLSNEMHEKSVMN